MNYMYVRHTILTFMVPSSFKMNMNEPLVFSYEIRPRSSSHVAKGSNALWMCTATVQRWLAAFNGFCVCVCSEHGNLFHRREALWGVHPWGLAFIYLNAFFHTLPGQGHISKCSIYGLLQYWLTDPSSPLSLPSCFCLSSQYLEPRPGNFVSIEDGKVMGEHKGKCGRKRKTGGKNKQKRQLTSHLTLSTSTCCKQLYAIYRYCL